MMKRGFKPESYECALKKDQGNRGKGFSEVCDGRSGVKSCFLHCIGLHTIAHLLSSAGILVFEFFKMPVYTSQARQSTRD